MLQTFGLGHDIGESPFIRPVRLPRWGRRRHLDFGLSEHLLQVSFARERKLVSNVSDIGSGRTLLKRHGCPKEPTRAVEP